MPVILDEGLSCDLFGTFVYLAAVLLFTVGNDTFLILQVNHIHSLRVGPVRCWALWRCTIRTRTPGPLYNPCYRAGACLVLWFISMSTPERMTIRATCKTTRAGLGLRDSIYMYTHTYHTSIWYDCCNDFIGYSCIVWFSEKFLWNLKLLAK